MSGMKQSPSLSGRPADATVTAPLVFLSTSNGRPARLRAQTSWSAADEKPTIAALLAEFEAACALAARCGLSGNQMVLSACKAVSRTSGIDPMQLLGLPGLEGASIHVSPRQLGRHLGLSARAVNLRLADLRMQRRIAGVWTPTGAGEDHAVVLDVGKRHGDGAPVTQLRWKLSILSVLDPTDMLAPAARIGA